MTRIVAKAHIFRMNHKNTNLNLNSFKHILLQVMIFLHDTYIHPCINLEQNNNNKFRNEPH